MDPHIRQGYLSRRMSAARLDTVDWARVATDLRDQPYARLGPLLTSAECRELVGLYADDARFRSTVDMERHRFGRGDYKYFAHPLPPLVAELRERAYPPLAAIANSWQTAL